MIDQEFIELAQEYWAGTNPVVPWELLKDEHRESVLKLYAASLEPPLGPSEHALRAALRSANIQLRIMERKLMHANERLEKFEASKKLVQAMLDDAEGTCP